MDCRNNVIYNWRDRSCDGKPMSVNLVNNYDKPGPATLPHVARCIARIDDTTAAYGTFESRWHVEGNVVEGAADLGPDNWSGGVQFEGGTSESVNREPGEFPHAPVGTQSAEDAYGLVLADAGATRPARDAVDLRVLREVADGTAACGDHGIIDRPGDAGGWPLLAAEAPPDDTDRDGMPDAWEEAHGLDPRDASDGTAHGVHAAYSNLETYLNELAGPAAGHR